MRARQGTGDEIYLGNYLFKGTEYTSMQGSDGTTAPFMSGWVFGLSQNLAKTIVEQDWMHSILVAPYGTSSESRKVGWLGIHNHNLTVDYVAEQRLIINIPDPEKEEDEKVPSQVTM